jgi:hypothetical protein
VIHLALVATLGALEGSAIGPVVAKGSSEMTLAGANSLHQRLDPLPTQALVAVADCSPVQHKAERSRIKQGVI